MPRRLPNGRRSNERDKHGGLRLRLNNIRQQIGWTEHQKLELRATPDGELIVVPFDGTTLDPAWTTVSLDSQRPLTVPVGLRYRAGIEERTAVLLIGDTATGTLQIITPGYIANADRKGDRGQVASMTPGGAHVMCGVAGVSVLSLVVLSYGRSSAHLCG